jgi:hypothetical protein
MLLSLTCAMLVSLWRRLWNSQPNLSRPKCPREKRNHSHRPGFDVLEDRLAPAQSALGIPQLATPGLILGVGGTPALGQLEPANPAPVSGLQPITGKPPGATNPIQVRVTENAPATVLDLSAAFGAMTGIQHEDGLRLRLLGNTNSGLIRTDLCEAVLTLSYSRGRCGTATITVAATDADGVSVQTTIQITVSPPMSAAPRGTSARS